MAQFAVGPQITQIWPGGGRMLVANQDLVNPVTISIRRNVALADQDADVVPPLGSIAYDAGPARYAIAPAGTAALMVIRGGSAWAPSPAQVALQISALGLARDTTVQGVTGAVQAQTSGNPIAVEIAALGVPPAVPQLTSVSITKQGTGTSPFLLITFPAAGRIWSVVHSYAIETLSTYANTGGDQFISTIATGSGLLLTPIELGASGTGQTPHDTVATGYNGLPIRPGDTVLLNINNGAVVTGVVQRASCTVLYSVP